MAEDKSTEPSSKSGKKDGTLEIKVTPDKLQAFLELTRPEGGGKPVSVDQVTGKLSEMGIKAGDLQALVTFIKSENYGAPLLIAQGRPAKNGRDAEIAWLYQEKSKQKTEEDKFGQVDFHKYSSFILAKEGELLAMKTPATEGEDGCNVFGEPVKAEPGKDAALTAGENIRVSPDGTEFSAAQPGVVSLQGTALSVEPLLVCEGDVDFNVGNIDFDGSVSVGGTIGDGFTVKATGDISTQTISKANVEAGRNLIVEKGIIGSEDTTIKAKGDIGAKFIESANVLAGGSIVVSETIMHSHVSAAKHVVVRGGKRASIVGGEVLAGGDIEAKTLGGETNTKTFIEIGIDPETRKHIHELQKEVSAMQETHDKASQELAMLTKLKERSRTLPSGKEARLRELQQTVATLSGDLQPKHAELSRYQSAHSMAKPGFVSVKEKAYPGLTITILDQSLYLNKEQRSCRFYLNRDKKEVSTSDFKEVDAPAIGSAPAEHS